MMKAATAEVEVAALERFAAGPHADAPAAASAPSRAADYLELTKPRIAVMALFTVAVGLIRILSAPVDVERLMAVQLLGTGGIAALLLVATATDASGVEDVALGLALLAAFASVAFVNSAAPPEGADEGPGGR